MILKEGTEDSSGKGQILSNINACQAVVDVVKTTLGKFNQKTISMSKYSLHHGPTCLARRGLCMIRVFFFNDSDKKD